MPISPEDVEKKYHPFITERVKALASFQFSNDIVLWHYTTGAGLIGIIESGTLYSTQVSCLNDSSEIRYASSIFKNALLALLPKYSADESVASFLKKYLELIEDEPERPNHAPSLYFVTCFSQQEDDLTQWRSYCGGENGYAIGFAASNLFGNPNSTLVRVNYNRTTHEKIAAEIAEATVDFFCDGLNNKRAERPEKWAEEFLTFWDPSITRLAPLVKDPGFAAENEYRIVHELQKLELKDMKILQKKTMMSRHLPLSFPAGPEAWVPRLPLKKVIVGPADIEKLRGFLWILCCEKWDMARV